MISVEEAKTILMNAVEVLDKTSIKTNHALGFVLAEDIIAPLSLPPFNQSNVDGYAVNTENSNQSSWKVVQQIKTGDNITTHLNPGEAARIYTGAMVPSGANVVLMQEVIERNENDIFYTGSIPIKIGEHIRSKGAQIEEGELAIKKGSICTPAVIGFINSLGIEIIHVIKRPSISLIITGNELQKPGTQLIDGKVYESNSAALQTALQSIGLSVYQTLFVEDNKQSLYNAVESVLKNSDILILSGGISVGDYDFVKEILESLNTTQLFYRVAQKPGKPLYAGKNKKTFIFALPGNPSSALTCFYEYVYPVLRKMQGQKKLDLAKQHLKTSKNITKKSGLAYFLKAYATQESVEPLEGQDSFIIRTLTEANAFIYLPAEKVSVNAGENVEVHLLPEL